MSDVVDDLDHAEARIERLTQGVIQLRQALADRVTPSGPSDPVIDAFSTANSLLSTPYCRATCYGFTGPCPECGGIGLVTGLTIFAGVEVVAEHVCPTCSGDGDGCNADDCGCPCGHPIPTTNTTQETTSP